VGAPFAARGFWSCGCAAAGARQPEMGWLLAADRPPGKGSVFLSRSGKWRFSAVGGEQTKKTVLKFKISQKLAKNSFKIALNSSEAQPAWSLHATWVNNATEHKPALSVEQQLGPGAPIRAINVRCKTQNQMLRRRTPHPNDNLGELLWHVASQYLATDLHDVHRFDFTLPSMREGPDFT
jgi:hypothetical protein